MVENVIHFSFYTKMILLTVSKLRHQMESKIKQFNVCSSQIITQINMNRLNHFDTQPGFHL